MRDIGSPNRWNTWVKNTLRRLGAKEKRRLPVRDELLPREMRAEGRRRLEELGRFAAQRRFDSRRRKAGLFSRLWLLLRRRKGGG